MPKVRGTSLPKNFAQLLEQGRLGPLKAVFETRDVNARGGVLKCTALAFDTCPQALTRWLVAQGADVNARDAFGATPLHAQSRSWFGDPRLLLELGADPELQKPSIGTALHFAADSQNAINAGRLLAKGAKVDALNQAGLTPLEWGLKMCSTGVLTRLPAFVKVMLAAGAKPRPALQKIITTLGEEFEFRRDGYNPETVDAASAALELLYETFQVAPVARRQVHDSAEPIRVKSSTWQKQHAELWRLLVPASGPAKTVQGEVIRITGRLSNEWAGNGGINWDREYLKMAQSLARCVQLGTPLAKLEVASIRTIVSGLATNGGAAHAKLAELAVRWVLMNRQPLALAKPKYRR